jgi:hypothetical protein
MEFLRTLVIDQPSRHGTHADSDAVVSPDEE